MRLGLCIVGCGQYARTVAREIAPLNKQVELFFASRDRERAKEYCRAFGGSDFFGNYEEAARDPRVEALYFFTPHDIHCENALLAAKHSKHILVEKPIARNLEEGRRMIEAAQDASVKLMVGENARFIPVVQKCKELIDQGAIGELRLIQVQSEQEHSPTDWRRSLEINGGGALIDGGIHAVDNMIYLGGMPLKVYATTLPKVLPQMEGEDGIVLMGQMENGATGLVNFSWGNASSHGPWASITGAMGRIHVDIRSQRLTLNTGDEQKEFLFPEGDYGRKNMVTEFVNAIRLDRPPSLSGEEGMKSLSVVLSAYESARAGAPVPVG